MVPILLFEWGLTICLLSILRLQGLSIRGLRLVAIRRLGLMTIRGLRLCILRWLHGTPIRPRGRHGTPIRLWGHGTAKLTLSCWK